MSADIIPLAFIALILWFILRRRVTALPGEIVYQDTPDAPTLVSQLPRLGTARLRDTQEYGTCLGGSQVARLRQVGAARQ